MEQRRERALAAWVTYVAVVGLLAGALSAGVWQLGTSLSRSAPQSRALRPQLPGSEVVSGSEVLLSSTSVPASRPFSCAPSSPGPISRGDRLVETARLGRYSATLSGRVEMDLPWGDAAVVLAHPLLTVAYRGRAPVPVPMFSGPSAEVLGLGVGSGSWSAGASYPASNLCLAQAGYLGPEVVVPTVPTSCNQCLTQLRLYDVGSLLPVTTATVATGVPDIFASGRQAVIVGNDAAFMCRLTSCDYSTPPIKVYALGYQGAGEVFAGQQDVTSAWPGLVAKDASSEMALYRSEAAHPPYDARGVLGAWAADECELGSCSQAFARLESIARAGRLAQLIDQSMYPSAVSAAGYLSSLSSLLSADAKQT